MTDFKPHEAPVNEAQALPVALPGKLVGRETALAQVYAQLKANNPVLVYGDAGTGKTALAATLASAYAQQPGGVLWMNVDNPRLEELLVRVGRAYKVNEITSSDNPIGMIGAVENTLKSQKPFIVIDGSIQAGVAARFISRCVDNLPLLLLCEQAVDGTWTDVELEMLDHDQAVTLFKQESRLSTDDADEQIGELVELVDNLPLAIVLAARAMIASKKPPQEFLAIMQQVANAVGQGAEAALTVSFRTLTGALQGVLLMMGATFSGKASAELLSMMSGAPEDSIVQAMNILAQLNLVGRTRRYGEFYYILHPTVHEFAQESLRRSNRLGELQAKALSSVLAYARQHSAVSPPNSKNKLAMEMDNFLAAARWAVEQERREAVGELSNVISNAGDFVSERGYLYELRLLRELSTGKTAFPAYDEDESQPVVPILPEDEDFDDFDDEDDDIEFDVDDDALEVIAEINEDDDDDGGFDLQTDDLAVLRTALAQARQDDDVEQQIDILKRTGQVQIDQEQETEAIATYNELLTVHEDQEDNEGILDTLDMLSALMIKTDNIQAGIMNATRGVKLAEELDDSETKLQLLITLGDARQKLGESEQAIKDYEAALEIARMSDDRQNEAIILHKLGFARLDDGDTQLAIDTWEKALELFKAQDKRAYEGKTLGGLGSAYGEMGRWAEAVNFHTSALYIARETEDKEEEGLQLSSLAYAATQAGQLGEAVLRYRQALHLAYDSGDEDNIISTVVDLSRLLLESRRHVSVAELLVEDALDYDENDKDLMALRARLDSEKLLAESYGTKMIAVTGTAQDYAANAYKLLEG